VDPRFALGYAGLADAWSLLGLYALRPPKEAFPRAKEAARRALQLDDGLAEAHTSLGIARFFYDWDWPAAEGDLERAIEINPNYVSGHHIRSSALSALGRHEDALAEARIALDLEPLSMVTILNLGWVMLNARDLEGTIGQCRRALELEPEFPRAHELMGLALASGGRMEEAAEQAQRVIELTEGSPRSLALCGYIFATAGRKGEARGTVAALRKLAAHQYVPALSMAFVSAALGKLDAACGWLERAYDEQDSLLVWLRVEPRLEKLRGDTRFQDLVERVGLRLWR
jgi:tetratricopeptide (TPR) repeat protein